MNIQKILNKYNKLGLVIMEDESYVLFNTPDELLKLTKTKSFANTYSKNNVNKVIKNKKIMYAFITEDNKLKINVNKLSM